MRRNITTLLRCHDYEPVAAANGREGVEAARREQPDLSFTRLFTILRAVLWAKGLTRRRRQVNRSELAAIAGVTRRKRRKQRRNSPIQQEFCAATGEWIDALPALENFPAVHSLTSQENRGCKPPTISQTRSPRQKLSCHSNRARTSAIQQSPPRRPCQPTASARRK